jgi:rubrerythrin
MDNELRHRLEAQTALGGMAYVRNLAAAEVAITRGQFNLAKVLRALAHSQRVQATGAARLLVAEEDPATVLGTIVTELESPPTAGVSRDPAESPTAPLESPAAQMVRERAQAIAQHSITSIQRHRDVAESDVAQDLVGCYSCGNLIEVVDADRAAPEVCDVCGALAPELAWFEPFYSVTPEHLGQHRPAEILAILAAGPDDVAGAVAGLDDAALRRKPSPDEWCVKEIVAHLLETELLFTRRVNATLAHDGPGLPTITSPVPPWKLHEGKGYIEQPIEEIVARLRATRAATLALVGGLSPAAWARRGSSLGGAASVLDLGTWLANHDLGHLVQVRQLCGRADAGQRLEEDNDAGGLP